MTIERVRASYGARVSEYTEAVGRIEHVADVDLDLVGEWALANGGPLLDVGCGPGQWTHWLSSRGVEVAGIDPVPEFVQQARAMYPDATFRIGQADSLGVDPGSLGGVLAWYSLIHADPVGMQAALAEFARCIRPRGGLLLGFFAGATLEPFAHAVTPAHYWPVDLLAGLVEEAGFEVIHRATRTDPGVRTHGEIMALRRS